MRNKSVLKYVYISHVILYKHYDVWSSSRFVSWLNTSHESEFVRDFKEGLGSLWKALEEDHDA